MTLKDLQPGTLFKFFLNESNTYLMTDEPNHKYVNVRTGETNTLHEEDLEIFNIVVVQHNDILKAIEEDLDREEKQIIYNGLIHDMFRNYEMSKSNHFAKDLFEKEANTATDLIKRIHKIWKWDIIY